MNGGDNMSLVSAKVIQVIEVTSVIGTGVIGDPHRNVVDYLDLDGARLARHDDWLENERANRAVSASRSQE